MRTITFLLLPGVHLMDLAGPAQVFYEAQQLGRLKIRVQYAALNARIATAQALPLAPTLKLEDIYLGRDDYLCIPGVDFAAVERGDLDELVEQVSDWLHLQHSKGVLIGSICSGALILAKAGLLNGRACTTHWKCMDYLETHFPLTRLKRNRLYCFDDGVFTSAGMTSGIDMSLALVERWSTPLVAAKVAQEMVINVRRPETQNQENTFLNFKNHFHPQVYKAQELLANDLELSVEELSDKLHLSSRQLIRLFKRHTGQTLQAYRNQVRLAHAEQLLLHSKQSVQEIALACGYTQARPFIRLWKQSKGSSPGQWRKQHAVD